MNASNWPVAPFLFLGLLLLPVRLSPAKLRVLAFALWLLGGTMLVVRGVLRFQEVAATAPPLLLWLAVGGALVIGLTKGRFVLAKTSARNRARLAAAREPLRPVQVYPARSWLLIAFFMLLGLSLAWFGAPLLWRAAVSLAVGTGLVTSSFAYLRS